MGTVEYDDVTGEVTEPTMPGGTLDQQPSPVALQIRAADVRADLVMTAGEALARLEELKEFVRSVMVPEEDFGEMPGGKAGVLVLFQPGAQKLLEVYGYYADPIIEEKHEDWGTLDGGPEPARYPFWHYRIRANIISKRTGNQVAAGYGSCNSREKKYLYRTSELLCPVCGKPNVRKSKNDPEWYCWQKTGGCGTKWKLTDPAITGQKPGRVLNPEPYDLPNTILKMAVKRAVVAGAIAATRSAMLFTQDLTEESEPDHGYGAPDLQEQKELARTTAPGVPAGAPRGAVDAPRASEGRGAPQPGPAPHASYQSEQTITKADLEAPTVEQLARLKKYCEELSIGFTKDQDNVWVDFPQAVFYEAWNYKRQPKDTMLTVWTRGRIPEVSAAMLNKAFSVFEKKYLGIHDPPGVARAEVQPPPPGEPF